MISILFIRRIVQIWYKRKGDAEGVYSVIVTRTVLARAFRKDTSASDEGAEVETGRNQEKDEFRIDSGPHSEIRISHHRRSAKAYWYSTSAHHAAAASLAFKRQYQLAVPQSGPTSNTVFVISLIFTCRPLSELVDL